MRHVVAYRYITRGGRDEEAKEAFKVFDKKEKGSVSMAEIKTVLVDTLSQTITDDDVKEFMKEIDPNNNGVIYQKDFLKLYNP